MKTIKKFLCISVLWVIACQPPKKEVVFSENDLNVIPRPQSLTMGKGSFRFTKETIFVSDVSLTAAARLFAEQFERASGIKLPIKKEAVTTNYIALVVDKSLPKEGYSLWYNLNIYP